MFGLHVVFGLRHCGVFPAVEHRVAGVEVCHYWQRLGEEGPSVESRGDGGFGECTWGRNGEDGKSTFWGWWIAFGRFAAGLGVGDTNHLDEGGGGLALAEID